MKNVLQEKVVASSGHFFYWKNGCENLQPFFAERWVENIDVRTEVVTGELGLRVIFTGIRIFVVTAL